MLELKECKMNHVKLCSKINELRKMEGSKKELAKSDLLKKIRKEVGTMKTLGIEVNDYFKPVTYKDKKGEMRPTFLISIKGLEWLRDNNIHDVRAYNEAIKELNPSYSQEYINIASINIRKELLINQILLAWFNEEQIKTQYPILNYRLDYYIPDVQLVIEYDELTGHKDKIKDKNRMDKIVDVLYEEWAKDPDVSYDEYEEYQNNKYDIIQVIRIKEGEESKGLNELFEYLTGDVKYYSRLDNLTR